MDKLIQDFLWRLGQNTDGALEVVSTRNVTGDVANATTPTKNSSTSIVLGASRLDFYLHHVKTRALVFFGEEKSVATGESARADLRFQANERWKWDCGAD